MKNSKNKISCCLIGQGKLTVDCAQQLLDHENIIHGIVSANSDVRHWADTHNIPNIGPEDDQLAFLKQWNFDFLFSIINPNKISNELLQLPQRSAINFHDAPLPRYAGLHVTSWAIINQEQHFGVTWHEMTEQFDAGQIVKQIEFPIEPDETVFSLNVKCFQHGRALFAELIEELSDGRESRKSQDLEQRSSFLSSKRPNAAALIDWSACGEEIEAMARALSYSPDPNPLGIPKMIIGDEYFLVTDVELKNPAKPSKPGTLHKVSIDQIEVATRTAVLAFTSLQTVEGNQINFSQLIRKFGLKQGDILPLLTASEREEINELDHRYGRHEKFWQGILQSIDPYQLGNEPNAVEPSTPALIISDTLTEDQCELLLKHFPESDIAECLAGLFCCFLRRIGEPELFDLGLIFSDNLIQPNLFATEIPFRVSIDPTQSIISTVTEVKTALNKYKQKGTFSRDLFARIPGLTKPTFPVAIEILNEHGQSYLESSNRLTLSLIEGCNQFQWRFAPQNFDNESASELVDSFHIFLQNAFICLNDSLASIALISAEEKQKILVEWNQTSKNYERNKCIHHVFEEQVAQRPHDIALAYRDTQLSYKDLNERSDRVAQNLLQLGALPDTPVGIFIDRSIEMIIGLMGILKSGAAYVPLDPAYPRDRIALMISDAKLPILLTHSKLVKELPDHTAQVYCIDKNQNILNSVGSNHLSVPRLTSKNLAYVIYTSGSTGKPKGVMIEHQNVINFFAGMDDTLEYDGVPGVWLAVTSISFDISVLEIFWSLCRGFKVVIQEEDARTFAQKSVSSLQSKMEVGLFYFSSDAGPSTNTNRYRLLLEGAKFADNNNFSTVWTPERHFHLFGGLYPNPSVTSAAIAAVTSNIAIRAGSIVLPLHNPVRVVEEWSVVDNLSHGRVGFSFASGWHANDFSLMPENYENRKQLMFDNIELVRTLWAGESITMNNGQGEPFTARIYPAPIQNQPPIWITTAGNIDSFRMAGEGGFNVLTNLLGQSIAEIKEKINAYREGRKNKGHLGDGNVTVMVHTFVGTDVEEVKNIVREPFCNYLKTSFDLVKVAPWAFPAFRQPSKHAAQDPSFDANSLTDEDMDALLEHAFDRYFETAGIFGTPASCIPLIDELKKAGVNEIACLIDFGVDDTKVLDNLQYLNELRQLANPPTSQMGDTGQQNYSISAQIERHKVTHFQCTPSMARILSADPDTLASLAALKKVLLGGEALPSDLAATLKKSLSGELINVYGPTETTIWSTSGKVSDNTQKLTIGRPIANTQIYILDHTFQPSPVGIPGELFIGGEGVVRGYLERPELTAERFIANPFVNDTEARIYRTGDLARYRENGEIEYLGRLDNQIKLRGYRIELGEIESLICEENAVRDAVVVAELGEDIQSLIAYVVPALDGPDLKAADENSTESTDHWHTIWDETYQAGTTYSSKGEQSEQSADPTLNISGWLNSYTGEQHPESHMREWATATADRILALKPKRVLEIGCGTGMVLYRVAPHCQQYVGVDFSANALSLIQNQLNTFGWNNVQLVQSAADELTLADNEPFDLVIINSVIQYFPSGSYLVNVLKHISTLMTENGQFFIGDVRSLPLLNNFHHSIELAKAPASLSLAELQHRVNERGENESELVLHPDFFFALQQQMPAIGNIDVQLKRGEQHNEMSVFRYDVCLNLGQINNTLGDSDFETLTTPSTLEEIKQTLSNQPKCFVLRDIVNPRIDGHLFSQALMKMPEKVTTVSDIHDQVEARGLVGIDPEQVYQLSSSWCIKLTWARSGKKQCYDAYFVSPDNQGKLSLGPSGELTSISDYYYDPVQHSKDHELIERLRDSLRDKLPEFMVPSDFMVLEALPLTPNGKIDRKALPKPERRQRDAKEEYVAPESDIEQAIASVLQEILNIEKIGINDNFSEVGANSLIMVQANNRLSQKLQRKVSLVSMYRYPTIASLAEFLSGNVDSKQVVDKGQKRGEKRKAALTGRKQRLASRRNKTN